jgi:hypothetical protein
MPNVSNQQKIINEITAKLEKNNLLVEKNGKKTLNLEKFNVHLENASDNLGEIIPGIVQISKEQVALINHGLEGTINFISSFQTLNTAFAVFAEKPDALMKYSKRIEELENLEDFILKDVNLSLVNMESMLKATFKEVAGYYTALANIIYSEEEGGTIRIDYKRNAYLENLLDEVMGKDRQKGIKKSHEMKKSLGLVQIIQSLVYVSKDIRKIDISSEKSIEETYIKTSGGESITIDRDVVDSLKSISAQLLDSLNNAGLFIDKQGEEVRIIKQIGYEELILAQNGTKALDELEKTLGQHKKITQFFIESSKKVKGLENMDVASSDKAKLFEEISRNLSKQEDAKKVHDDIIKKQMGLIVDVVNTFASIVSLWGHQVDKEISIAQVAGKSANALEKLAKVQVSSFGESASVEPLLVAKKTQESIEKTCNKAKELKNVEKVMQYLLGRVKDLVSFNRGIESQIRETRKEVREAAEYKREQLKSIKKVLYERYSEKQKKIAKIINNFNDKISRLASNSNIKENEGFIEKLLNEFAKINSSLMKSIGEIEEKTIIISKNPEKFPKSCEELGLILDKSDNKVDLMFDHLQRFNKIFSDDFRIYSNLSQSYKELLDGITPFMTMIDYISSTQKSLISKKIDLRELNQYLKAFLKVFEARRKSQAEEASIDADLSRIMREVKMDKDHYYEKYIQRMGKGFELLKELEEFTKEYFSNAQDRLSKAYSMAENWTQMFSFEFKEYNKKLKDMNYGFLDKLFRTENYKEKDFFLELKTIENSFERIDLQIDKLSRLNLKKAGDVPEFCKTSVVFVNEMLSGYKELASTITKVSEVINIINNNLNIFKSKNINTLANFLAIIKENNEKIGKIEADFDFDELDKIRVEDVLRSLNSLTDFSSLSRKSEANLAKLKKIEPVVVKTVEDFKNALLIFYTSYLTNENVGLEGSEKEKYESIKKTAQERLK